MRTLLKWVSMIVLDFEKDVSGVMSKVRHRFIEHFELTLKVGEFDDRLYRCNTHTRRTTLSSLNLACLEWNVKTKTGVWVFYSYYFLANFWCGLSD